MKDQYLKYKRLFCPQNFFLILMLILLLITIVATVFIEDYTFQGVLYYNKDIMLSDFYDTIRDSYGLRPYDVGVIYHALVYFFYAFMGTFVNAP